MSTESEELDERLRREASTLSCPPLLSARVQYYAMKRFSDVHQASQPKIVRPKKKVASFWPALPLAAAAAQIVLAIRAAVDLFG